MRIWLATGLTLLVGLFALAALLVDPGVWPSSNVAHDRSSATLASAPSGSGSARRHRRPRRSPYELRPARAHLPVHVGFAHKPRAGILFDIRSGRVLWEHDPGRELPIASLTKMISALIIAHRHHPSERVLITRQAVHFQGSGVGVLPKGKRVPLGDLFYGLLLVSGNDAAIALAQHDAGSVPAFVNRMNSTWSQSGTSPDSGNQSRVQLRWTRLRNRVCGGFL